MWPGLQAVASKFQDKPVLFLAVNSGTPRPQLQSYLRKNRVRWPAIADTDRSFERGCGVPPISLQNIYQVRIMKPDGKLVATSPTRMEQTLAGVIGAAKWNVDPAGIPAALKTAWFHVEFGNFAMAATTLKKARNSRKPETKQGARKLLDYVGEKMNKQVETAKTAEADGKVWEAFRGYSDAAVRYKGYELPRDIAATINKLKGNADVKKEVAALRILAAAKRKLYGKTVSSRKSGYRALERLADQQSETQAGREAQQLIKALGTP
jgi:hypothetical protein